MKNKIWTDTEEQAEFLGTCLLEAVSSFRKQATNSSLSDVARAALIRDAEKALSFVDLVRSHERFYKCEIRERSN